MGGPIMMVLIHGVWKLHHGARLGCAFLVGHTQVMTFSSSHFLWPDGWDRARTWPAMNTSVLFWKKLQISIYFSL